MSSPTHSSSPAAASPAGARRAGASQAEALRPTKLFLGGLTRNTTTKHLRDHFVHYGRVLDCVAMRHPDGRPRGFGYVTLDSPCAADRVLAEPQIIDSREIDVKRAVPGTNGAGGYSPSASSAAAFGRSPRSAGGFPACASPASYMNPGLWADVSPFGFPGSPTSPAAAAAWASWAVAAATASQMAAAMATSPAAALSSLRAEGAARDEALDCLSLLQGSVASGRSCPPGLEALGHAAQASALAVEHEEEEEEEEMEPVSPLMDRSGSRRPRPHPLKTPTARGLQLFATPGAETGETPQKVALPSSMQARQSRTVLGDITPSSMAGSGGAQGFLLQDPIKAPLPSPIGSNRALLPSPGSTGKARPYLGKENGYDKENIIGPIDRENLFGGSESSPPKSRVWQV